MSGRFTALRERAFMHWQGESDGMRNRFLRHLEKIEFVVTNACTGRCKHCSEGEHPLRGERIDPEIAADAVRKISSVYDVKTVMAFGGEPLLYTDAVEAIMNAAREKNIPRRQVITNGYFSKDPERIGRVARMLADCGVNDLLLSVDAFHGECIPMDTVRLFASEVKRLGIKTRISPAWLVSATDDNPYNEKTRAWLRFFADLEIPVGEGNVVFFEGSAKKYLAEYFTGVHPINPYEEDASDVRCVSFSPNGDVLGKNVYKTDILEIIKNYTPDVGEK